MKIHDEPHEGSAPTSGNKTLFSNISIHSVSVVCVVWDETREVVIFNFSSSSPSKVLFFCVCAMCSSFTTTGTPVERFLPWARALQLKLQLIMTFASLLMLFLMLVIIIMCRRQQKQNLAHKKHNTRSLWTLNGMEESSLLARRGGAIVVFNSLEEFSLITTNSLFSVSSLSWLFGCSVFAYY